MMGVCSAVPAGAGFVSSMTGYVDCQAQILGSGAWQALAAPGSTLALLLTGFVTIFVALIGYKLLLGHSMTVRDGTLALVKIGAVFALATSWPAYRTLVYDVVTDGPSQLVAEIGPSAGVAGSGRTLLQRLDRTGQALTELAVMGPGNPPADAQVPPPLFSGFDTFALGGSRILFLLTAIGGLAVVRVVTGLMLALGPFFIAFVLFDSTRSLFEGWVRVLAGAALAAIGISIALGLELALLEPWLSGVLARRAAGEALPTVPTEAFVIVTLFTIVALASLYACAAVARAFRLPSITRTVPVTQALSRTAQALPEANGNRPSRSADRERSRAAAVASVLAATTRRESRSLSAERMLPAVAHAAALGSAAGPAASVMPVGRTFTRRANSRASARANRRDAVQ
jgi:type IV secretion system protein VirB6